MIAEDNITKANCAACKKESCYTDGMTWVCFTCMVYVDMLFDQSYPFTSEMVQGVIRQPPMHHDDCTWDLVTSAHAMMIRDEMEKELLGGS